MFRDGVEDYFREVDSDSASRRTLDTSLQIGLETLCDGRRGFVNCTRDVLLKDYMTLLPSPLAVVEVLESVPPDDLVLAGLKRLKEAPWRCRMLAEKVETREEFTAAAKAAGFIYFQGYFFRRPEVLHAKEIPANRLNCLRLLKTVSEPEVDVRELEAIIKQEASVCYRLLRYLNSAAFAIQNEVHSIRHALTLLGEREVRRWVCLVATLTAGEKKSSELLVSAMVRARFCELLSPKVPHGEVDLFLMGLLSMVDAILEIPMLRVVETMPVDHDTKTVLLGGGGKLRPLYDLRLARESGDWNTTAALARQLSLSDSDVSHLLASHAMG